MKIATAYMDWLPVAPFWCAYVEDLEDDSPQGTGTNELSALEDLLWQVDDRPGLSALVEDRIKQIRGGEA